MKHTQIIHSAVVGVLALGVVATANAGPAEKPKFSAEKCYGVTKAGKNDCQTASSACAGTSRQDAQKDAWIYLPKGACDKIVGAGTKPKG
jgi:uncharacterized membrane protein